MTNSGSTRIPTKKSARASERNKILEGGWRHDSLERAMRIRVFPKVEVIARRIFEAVRNHNALVCLKAAEQNGSWELRFPSCSVTAMFDFVNFSCDATRRTVVLNDTWRGNLRKYCFNQDWRMRIWDAALLKYFGNYPARQYCCAIAGQLRLSVSIFLLTLSNYY